ncbi:RagB/SusD family nutrient uptake outer membrane protein [Flavivirga eckloniae]|uniref:RagB/SusD family nutrient uptake outer membrane protein n=1 Tax=Flavivirga eckloniae TaxID=1803846 RepID=A0A2K9PPP0_9FLAO|nr:RagB/SusD family nutrient uptake outer membrane protein [Flavivirga eckloniae]AUP78527.1 hypothetical protein C1H87_07310 [Flavivirga eckloniae]
MKNTIEIKIPIAKYITALLVLGVMLSACTDLEEVPLSTLSATEFNNTEDQVNATVRGVASLLGSGFTWTNLFVMDVITTDEGVIPTRAGGWNSNGERDLHEHQWSPTTENIRRRYAEYSNIIGRANVALESVDQTRFPSQYAEIRFFRALAYYKLLDYFRNVPIVTVSVQDPNNLAGNMPIEDQAQKVFDFVEQEWLEIQDDLLTKAEVGDDHYPRPIKSTASAFLVKLYLNAEVYIGVSHWNECIEQCNIVINSNDYSLTDDLQESFIPENQNSPEIIYAQPRTSLGEGIIFQQVQFQPELAWKFKLPVNGWGGFAVTNEHFAHYDDDDKRKTYILHGPQWVDDAQTEPLYKGASADGNGDPADGQFEILPLDQILDAPVERGYKSTKYVPDVNAVAQHSNNDVVVLRYADILLSKAEAILWGGTDPMGASPDDLVNSVRARSFDPDKPLSGVTLDDILNEREFEFSFEGHRRPDLIRHGKFISTATEFRINFDAHRIIFPIPEEQIDRNNNLQQNPGY